MGESERCQLILKRALSADESNDRETALELYTKFVEMTLSVETSATNKEKLQKLAVSAMDRAEVIKNEMTPNRNVKQDTVSLQLPAQPHHHVSTVGYSADEIRVLEHGSHINRLIIVPFMDVDLRERFNYPLPFTDPDGMLALAPKQKSDFGQWMRLSELTEMPTMVANKTIDFYSIKQTVVSDCSFVASLAVAASYERRFGKALVTSILYPKNSAGQPIYNPSGKYSIKLHVNGVARKVIVDDYLPVGRHKQLLCSYSNNRHEFWVSILEKAYMKVMGGYDFPGSNSNIDLHALTGWIPERISLRSETDTSFSADAVFERLKNGLMTGRCLLTAATGELSESDEARTGLVATHAYAVLDMREVNGVKLVQMKNPWSHLRWKGNYSELDINNWTEELKAELNYNPLIAEQVDNGIFWIDYSSVLRFFDVFYINWDSALFQAQFCYHQMWNAGIGPSKDAYTIADNPQFLLKMGSSSVWMLLTRHITSVDDFRDNREYISLVAYNNNGRKVYYPYDPKPFHEGVRINSPHYLCKINADPKVSKLITLVISQYEKTTTIYYTLRGYSRDKFELHKIESGFTKKQEISGKWQGITAGGCPNYPVTYKNNPKIRLTVGSRARATVLIELRAPKLYQVGFEVTKLSTSDTQVTFEPMSTGVYRSGYCMLEIESMPAGSYLIVPATFAPGLEGPFFITVKSAQNIIKLEDVTSAYQ